MYILVEGFVCCWLVIRMSLLFKSDTILFSNCYFNVLDVITLIFYWSNNATWCPAKVWKSQKTEKLLPKVFVFYYLCTIQPNRSFFDKENSLRDLTKNQTCVLKIETIAGCDSTKVYFLLIKNSELYVFILKK